MAPIKVLLLTALSLASESLAVRLLGTHFSGPIFTYDLKLTGETAGSLSISSNTTSGAVTPTWIVFDQDTRNFYVIDESWQGSGVLTQWSLDRKPGSAPKLVASAKTTGNSVHATLFGGKDGKGFIATTE